jgi:hypothetical protein
MEWHCNKISKTRNLERLEDSKSRKAQIFVILKISKTQNLEDSKSQNTQNPLTFYNGKSYIAG